MAESKKGRILQKLLPILILIIGVVFMGMFSGMKQPPAEKEKVDNTPIVAVQEVEVSPLMLEVKSYGVVKPKFETELISQVSGQIVELSDAFVRGGFVKEGELLARIDPSDYEAALIEAQASLATAKAGLEQEKAQAKVAEEEWKRITNASPTELSLRKPQLAQEIARVKAAQAAVLRAERNLERTQVKAPYDAMIEMRNIGLGAFVNMGSRLGKVLGTDVAEIRLPVPDSQLQFLIDQGIAAKVELEGKFSGQPMTWHAHVARSEGVIDGESRMSYLVAEVSDPYLLGLVENIDENTTPLRFGSYVNAKIQGQEIAQATTVPRYLVSDSRVPILNEELKLQYVDITILRQDGAQVVVSHGLNQGDRIITSALDFPVDGMQLALPSNKTDLEEKEAVEEEQEPQIASNEG
ncbi:efflux RND transporter periplasmic adaptor subunit [Thalassotalea agarivorans]|uniref:RND family efflux transporter, MFP subunit n=1 Tax=Thalassotalea agarivorans TaxID=349064 RepID=A0A1H9YA41_THASX|nr:efflux RND transporter periplasmic adaptor subunit [Thalassotalea agarivorans]SES65711.1 RND family efflux transporter, MFP subunit [Thalassotalea agarivorans]